MKDARQILARRGIVINKIDDEYCVRFAEEDLAYCTNDLEDAVGAGQTMADDVDKRSVRSD